MSFRAYLVELVGTLFLVFFCAAPVCGFQAASGEPGRVSAGILIGIALAQGAALAVLLTASTRVSQGCLNPAVTLALWVTRRFDSWRVLSLVIVQVIGAILGGALVWAVFDQSTLRDTFVGTPHLRAFLESPEHTVNPGDWLVGSLAEAALSFLVTLAILTAVLDPRRTDWPWGPLIAGLAMTAAVLAGYYLTGAAVNPARWLGTALWQKNVPTLDAQPVFRDHLPYWMGTIVGALLAGVAHTEWIRPRDTSLKR
jgi:aquaporin Z